MGLRAWIRIFVCCFAMSANAAPDAVVDAVQMPAWLDRGGRVVPLVPGQEVKSGDRVRTGEGARVYLKLAEGSTVKLGESAQLSFQTSPPENGVFRSAMDVLTGAFRFTTAALQKLRKRDVAIRVGTATIGIRGTDVWGKSSIDSDLVMLIEGDIRVQPAQGAALVMNKPKSVFKSPKGGAGEPLATATEDEFQRRARETDIWPGDGSGRPGGRWSLLLGSFADDRSALAVYDLTRDKGYATKVVVRSNESGTLQYQVVVAGFADQAEAVATASRLKAATGLNAKPIR